MPYGEEEHLEQFRTLFSFDRTIMRGIEQVA